MAAADWRLALDCSIVGLRSERARKLLSFRSMLSRFLLLFSSPMTMPTFVRGRGMAEDPGMIVRKTNELYKCYDDLGKTNELHPVFAWPSLRFGTPEFVLFYAYDFPEAKGVSAFSLCTLALRAGRQESIGVGLERETRVQGGRLADRATQHARPATP